MTPRALEEEKTVATTTDGRRQQRRREGGEGGHLFLLHALRVWTLTGVRRKDDDYAKRSRCALPRKVLRARVVYCVRTLRCWIAQIVRNMFFNYLKYIRYIPAHILDSLLLVRYLLPSPSTSPSISASLGLIISTLHRRPRHTWTNHRPSFFSLQVHTSHFFNVPGYDVWV